MWNYNFSSDLYKNCSLVTGFVEDPKNESIWREMSRGNYTIYTGAFSMAQLNRAIAEMYKTDPYQNFVTYEMFPHLKAKSLLNNNGPIYDDRVMAFSYALYAVKHHPLDEMLYSLGREFDQKILKRVNAFIEDERTFLYKY